LAQLGSQKTRNGCKGPVALELPSSGGLGR